MILMRNNTDKSRMRGSQADGGRIRGSIRSRKMKWSRMGALAACLVFCVFTAHGAADAEEYKYDALGRLEEAVYENGDAVRYSYDANGNIQSCEYQTGNGGVRQPDRPSAGTDGEGPSGGGGTQDQENKGNSGADDKGQDNKGQGDKGQDDKGPGNIKQDDKPRENTASTQKVKTGDVHKTKNAQYQVLSTGKNRTAALKRFTDGRAKTFTIPAAVRIEGRTYRVVMIAPKAFRNRAKLKQVAIGKNVTSIGSRAFYRCRSLKKIIVRTAKLKSVGRNAFLGISKKAVIRVPKKQYQRYVKLFRHKGQAKSVKLR